jgi:predicted AAA+ superfamily ATPase
MSYLAMHTTLMKELLTEFYDKFKKRSAFIPRQAHFSEVPNKILAAIGIRRSGKTVFLLQKIQALLDKKVPLTSILYINFEDDRLTFSDPRTFGAFLDGFYTVYPENHDRVCHFFLDEIQNVTGWATVLRRFLDSKSIRIYITGSSAKLLSREIATSLRGRSLAIEIWPFDFIEYLKKLNYEALIAQWKTKKVQDQLDMLITQYLKIGGFPEVISLDPSDRHRILQDYVDVVVFRDIVERYQITNLVLIKYMIKVLLKNAGSLCSVHKLYNDLKSQGFSLSKTTLHQYISYVEDAYLLFMVPLYSESIRKTQSNPRKVYAVDSGLVHAYSFSLEENKGHAFENLIYLDLRRHQHEIYYYLTHDRNEVDFFTRDSLGKLHLYQVAWDIADKATYEREERALKQAEKELGIQGEIITPETYMDWLKSFH